MNPYVIYSCCYNYVKNTKCLVIVKEPTPQNIYGNKSGEECDKLF